MYILFFKSGIRVCVLFQKIINTLMGVYSMKWSEMKCGKKKKKKKIFFKHCFWERYVLTLWGGGEADAHWGNEVEI